MNILIFSVEFPPDIGGAGTYARDLAVGLARIGHKATVLTCHHTGKQDAEAGVDDALTQLPGAQVVRVPFVPKLYPWVLAPVLYRQLRQNPGQFDAILLADPGAQKVLAHAGDQGANLDLPFWAVFHGTEVRNYFRHPRWAARLANAPAKLEKLLRRARGCIAVSHALRGLVLECLPDLRSKTHVVHHGIDTELFRPRSLETRLRARRKLGLCPQTSIVLSASRLIQKKGQDKLLMAVSELRRSLPDVLLVIAGIGPYRTALEQMARDMSLDQHVRFVGGLSRAEFALWLHACDVFAMVSRRGDEESFGLVYLEANACSCAVVAGRTGGVAESVENNVSGVLVDPLDTWAIRDALARLLCDEQERKRMESAAYARVLAHHTVEKMAQRTVDALSMHQ